MYLFIFNKKFLVDFQEYSSDGNDDEVLQCVDDFEIEKSKYKQ